jgi:hypothetical protein
VLAKSPRTLPPLSTILDSLGRPHPRAVGQALGVCERTVRGWISAGRAPRPAHLALFWVSPLGLSHIDSDREFLVVNLKGLVDSLRREASGLRARIAYLEAVARFDSANDPTFTPLDLTGEVPRPTAV